MSNLLPLVYHLTIWKLITHHHLVHIPVISNRFISTGKHFKGNSKNIPKDILDTVRTSKVIISPCSFLQHIFFQPSLHLLHSLPVDPLLAHKNTPLAVILLYNTLKVNHLQHLKGYQKAQTSASSSTEYIRFYISTFLLITSLRTEENKFSQNLFKSDKTK